MTKNLNYSGTEPMIASVLAKSGRLAEALTFTEQHIASEDRFSVKTDILGKYDGPKVPDLYALIDELIKLVNEPRSINFFRKLYVAKTVLQHGYKVESVKILEGMRAQLDFPIPSDIAEDRQSVQKYNSIAGLFVAAGQLETARDIAGELKDAGLEADRIEFYIATKLWSQGRFEAATKVLGQVSDEKLRGKHLRDLLSYEAPNGWQAHILRVLESDIVTDQDLVDGILSGMATRSLQSKALDLIPEIADRISPDALEFPLVGKALAVSKVTQPRGIGPEAW